MRSYGMGRKMGVTGVTVPARCPFYGFRWPDKTSDLHQDGGNECGLDVECNGPCAMEMDGRTVNYDYCEVPVRWKPMFEAFRDRILFHLAGKSSPICYRQWRDMVMR